MSLKFEWDEAKAEINYAKHGVDFRHASKIFFDPYAIEWLDDRENYGEDRMNLLGMCDGLILHITYTERNGSIRIISARRATKDEQIHYFRENSV